MDRAYYNDRPGTRVQQSPGGASSFSLSHNESGNGAGSITPSIGSSHQSMSSNQQQQHNRQTNEYNAQQAARNGAASQGVAGNFSQTEYPGQTSSQQYGQQQQQQQQGGWQPVNEPVAPADPYKRPYRGGGNHGNFLAHEETPAPVTPQRQFVSAQQQQQYARQDNFLSHEPNYQAPPQQQQQYQQQPQEQYQQQPQQPQQQQQPAYPERGIGHAGEPERGSHYSHNLHQVVDSPLRIGSRTSVAVKEPPGGRSQISFG